MWPKLKTCSDMGPDIFAAKNWKRAKKVNETHFFDLSHGGYGDTKLTVKKFKLWPHVLACSIMYSNHHVPFGNCTGWSRAIEVIDHYFILADPKSCPLLLQWWNEFCNDNNLYGADRTDPERIQQIWDTRIKRAPALFRKGHKLSTSRWRAITDAAEEHMPDWVPRRIVQVLVGIQLDVLTPTAFRKITEVFDHIAQSLADAIDADADGSIAAGRREVTSLRQKIKDAVLLALAILLSPESKRREKVIMVSNRVFRKWHGMCIDQLRCVGDCNKWFEKMWTGGFTRMIIEVLRQLCTKKELEDAGFAFSAPKHVNVVGVAHPKVVIENEFAALYAGMTVDMLGRTLRRMGYMWIGLPYRAYQMKCTQDEVAKRARDSLRRDLLIYREKVSQQDGGPWPALRKRSYFEEAPVQQIVAIMEKIGWDYKDRRWQAWLDEELATNLSSKPVEDEVRVQRHHEQYHTANKLMCKNHIYYNTIMSTVLHEEYKYAPLHGWKTQPMARGVTIPDQLYVAQPKTCNTEKLDFKEIMRGGQEPPWWTTTPDRSTIQVADIFMSRYADEEDKFEECKDTWLGAFVLQMPHVAISRAGSDVWFLPVQDLGGTGVLCLPLTKENDDIGFGTEWDVNAINDQASAAHIQELYHCFFVTNLDEWEAFPFRWVSPMEQVVVTNQQAYGIVIGQTQDCAPLLEVLAGQAFGQIGPPQLLQLAQHLDLVDLDAKSQLFDLLEALIKHALPAIDDQTLGELFWKRSAKIEMVDASNECLESVVTLLEDTEQEAAERHMKNEEHDREQMKVFLESVHAHARRTYGKDFNERMKKATKKGQRKAISKEFSDANYPLQKGRAVPHHDTISEATARSLTPPGTNLYKDVEARHWQICIQDLNTSRSRAWLRYGFADALRRVLRWAWGWRLKKDGLSLLECPVRGVFGERTGTKAIDEQTLLDAEHALAEFD